MDRTLCPRCTASVPKREMVHHGTEWLCRDCARQAGPYLPPDARPRPGVRERYARPPGLRGVREEVREWCAGRLWQVRLPFVIYFGWVAWNYLAMPLHPRTHEMYSSWFDGINLGFHELGHVVFRPFGRFLHALGGTILQLVMPLVAMWFLWAKQRDWFGVAFCLAWLATNFYGIGIYVADARTKQLVLVAPGLGMTVDGSIHDWAYLLGELGWLRADELLGNLMRVVGTAVMVIAMAFTVLLSWWMYKQPKPLRKRDI